MRLLVSEKGNMLFLEVFNAITLQTEDGELLNIAMRDHGFEFVTQRTDGGPVREYYIDSKECEFLAERTESKKDNPPRTGER